MEAIEDTAEKVSWLGILMSNPIAVGAVLIFVGAVFAFFSWWLSSHGLLTAAIFFVAGLALVVIIASGSEDTAKNHPFIMIFTPILLGVFGLLSDKVPFLSTLSLTDDVMQNDFAIPVGVILICVALLFLLIAYKRRK